MRNLNLIVDAGNSAIKAVLVEGNTILASDTIPSLLRYDDNCLYVMGGGKFASDSQGFIVGWDNENKRCIRVGDSEDGKLVYLPELLGACVSVFAPEFTKTKEAITLEVTVLTLQLQERELIKEAVEKLQEIIIDGVELKLKTKLANVLPESYGCSSYAANVHRGSRSVAVLDIGSGTANLSTYDVGYGVPRRKYFQFMPLGIETLVDLIAEELKASASNGRVNKGLIRFALTTNLYTLGYGGKDIHKQVDKAIVDWLELPEFKTYINQLKAYSISGIPITACGGGWMIAKVKEALLEKLGEVHVSEEVGRLGVAGVATIVIQENEIKEQQRLENSKRQTKTKTIKEVTPDETV